MIKKGKKNDRMKFLWKEKKIEMRSINNSSINSSKISQMLESRLKDIKEIVKSDFFKILCCYRFF